MNKYTLLLILFSLLYVNESVCQSFEDQRKKSINYKLYTIFESSLNTDLENGGELSFYRTGAGLYTENGLNKETTVGVGIDYLHDSFSFDGNDGLAGLEPWGHINRINISTRLGRELNDKWTFTISPGINFSGESGSDFGDSITYRGIAGFTYRVNKNLLVGSGIIATTRLEEDFIAFPGFIINWKINDDTILSSIITRIRPELGPVLSINHFFNTKFNSSFNISYEFSRFRLDEDELL